MTVLLLDGHNLVYRAFCSIPRTVLDADGLAINGVHGLLGVVLRLAREYDPMGIVVAFDTPETPTFRHRLYLGYQAQRGPLGGEHAEDFQRQIGIAQRVLPTIGVPAPNVPGYEADDIMATLAIQAAENGGQAIIVSTDRDLLQLVRPGIGVLVPGKSDVLVSDAEQTKARIGVAPKGVTEFKALAGDSSDNIPGVSGIGVKTAAALINEFGTLEGVYSHLDTLSTRTRAALVAQQADAFLFRQIVTLVTQVSLGFNLVDVARPLISAETRVRAILTAADTNDHREVD